MHDLMVYSGSEGQAQRMNHLGRTGRIKEERKNVRFRGMKLGILGRYPSDPSLRKSCEMVELATIGQGTGHRIRCRPSMDDHALEWQPGSAREGCNCELGGASALEWKASDKVPFRGVGSTTTALGSTNTRHTCVSEAAGSVKSTSGSLGSISFRSIDSLVLTWRLGRRRSRAPADRRANVNIVVVDIIACVLEMYSKEEGTR